MSVAKIDNIGGGSNAGTGTIIKTGSTGTVNCEIGDLIIVSVTKYASTGSYLVSNATLISSSSTSIGSNWWVGSYLYKATSTTVTISSSGNCSCCYIAMHSDPILEF